MSGGHWNYEDITATELLQEAGHDIREDYPIIGAYLVGLGSTLQDMFHELDWDYSADRIIDDKRAFETEYIQKLVKKLDLASILDDLIKTKEDELNFLKNKREGIE